MAGVRGGAGLRERICCSGVLFTFNPIKSMKFSHILLYPLLLGLAVEKWVLPREGASRIESKPHVEKGRIEDWFELRSRSPSEVEQQFAIDGWLTVELGSGEDAGFKLWETREALEFQRFAYGIGFDDLEFSEFLKKNYSPFNIDWQKHHQRLVRLCGTMKLTDPEVTGHRAIITKVEFMILVGVNGAIDGVIEKEKGAK